MTPPNRCQHSTHTMKILYNDYYGEFTFSEAFLTEYKVRTGKDINMTTALFHIGRNSIRCDPDAISIVEERGSAWSSGQSSELAIREIPEVFAQYWEIDEYDGNETVRVNVSEALADILDTYMETRDHAALDRQYAAIKAASKDLAETSCFGLRVADDTPTSSVPPSITITEEEDEEED